MNSQRVAILKAFQDRLMKKFGPEAAQRKYFREVKLGPWDPMTAVRDRLTIVDNGQSAAYATDSQRDNTLKIQLVWDLDDNWEREGFELWSNRIEEVEEDLQNWLPRGPGVFRTDYISDDPFTAVLVAGPSRQIWLIDFEVKYAKVYKDFEE